MATKVIMPKKGLQMTEGLIVKWLVEEGDQCTEGEPIFEVETDKLTVGVEAPVSGTVLKILAEENTTVPVADIVAYIGEAGEKLEEEQEKDEAETIIESKPVKEVEATSEMSAVKEASPVGTEKIYISPRAKMKAEERGIDYRQLNGTGPEGMIIERDVLSVPDLKATPLAKRIAQMENINLNEVSGTGSHGKITRTDVTNAASSMIGDMMSGSSIGKEEEATLIPFTGMRRIIADRMKQSQQTNAQTTHAVSVDMTEAKRMRETLKGQGQNVSYNDIICLATVRALSEFPAINAELTADGVLRKHYVNLGMAVALEEGLIVPVIRNAHKMHLSEMSKAAKDLAVRARNNTLLPDEYQGGTFTISNLGMMGIEDFVAIINPPESGILAVGAVIEKPVIVDGAVEVHPMTRMVLSYDHRVVDGAPAAHFLVRIKQLIENPMLLL